MDRTHIINELKILANEGLSGEAAEPAKEGQPRQNGVIETDYASRGFHLDAQVGPDQVVQAAEIIDRAKLTLETITGVDWIEESQFEIIYDYAYTGGDMFRVVVRTRVDRNNPELPTITGVFPGANWHERETWDLLGINFTGHPQLERFLLPEDCDFHPLRKDFQP